MIFGMHKRKINFIKTALFLAFILSLFNALSTAQAQTSHEIDETATAANSLKPGTRIAMYYAGRDKETNQNVVRIFQGVTTQGLYLVQEFYNDRPYGQQPYTAPYLIMPDKGLENVRDRTDIHDYDKVTITGAYTRLYPGGGRWSQGSYVEGLRNGIWRDWFSNGQLAQEIHYQQGKENGTIKTWFYTGQPRTEVSYIEGKEHGSCQQWHRNGTLHTAGQYVHGMREGIWVQWYSNGLKNVQSYYQNGQLQGEYLTWHENGQPYFAGHFEQGTPTGLWHEYDQQGKLLYEQRLETQQ